MNSTQSTIELWLKGQKPITINSAYETSSAHYKCKSTKTNQWLYDLKMRLAHHKGRLTQLKTIWRPSEHYLLVNYTHFLPEKELFVQSKYPKNRKGAVSGNSGDWSNLPKIPDDLIFNDLIGIDDCHICTGVVNKFPSPDDEYYLKLKIQIRTIVELRQRAWRELPEALK